MHAQVLNRVVDEIQYDVSLGSVADLELKEVLGHTPRQVGALQLNLYPKRAGRDWFQGRRRRHDCTRACRGICCAGWDRSDGLCDGRRVEAAIAATAMTLKALGDR